MPSHQGRYGGHMHEGACFTLGEAKVLIRGY